MPTNIKKVTTSAGTHDVEALHFITGSLDTPESWKTYIDNAVGKGLQIVIDTKHASKEEPATTASASTMGKLYLVTLTGQLVGSYTEFITIEQGTTTKTYSWEKIGTTEVDLSNYLKYNTQFDNAALSAGAHTHTVSGSVTVPTVSHTDKKMSATAAGTDLTVSKADSYVKSYPGATSKLVTTSVGSASAGTAFSVPNVTGNSNVSATLVDTPSVVSITPAVNLTSGKPTRTVLGTATSASKATAGDDKAFNIDAIKSASCSQSFLTAGLASASLAEDTATTPTFAFNTDAIKSASLTGTKTFNTNAIKNVALSASTTSTDGPTYVESVTHTAATLTGTKTFNTDAIKAAVCSETAYKKDSNATSQSAGYFMVKPVVDSNGVLSFEWNVPKIDTTAATTGTVGISGGSITPVTKYMKVTQTAADTGTVGISTTAATKKGIKLTTTAATATAVSISTAPALTDTITTYSFADVTVPVISSNSDVTVAQAGTAVAGVVKSGAATPSASNVSASKVTLGTAFSIPNISVSSKTVATGALSSDGAGASVMTGLGTAVTGTPVSGVSVKTQPTITLALGTTGDVDVVSTMSVGTTTAYLTNGSAAEAGAHTHNVKASK